MNRFTYLIVTIVTTIIGSFAMAMTKAMEQSGDSSGSAFSVMFLLAGAAYIVATFHRFKNAGINPWWALTGLIPLVTLGTWLVAIFTKPTTIEVSQS